MANLDLYKRKKRAVPSSGGSGREGSDLRTHEHYMAHEPFRGEYMQSSEDRFRGEYMQQKAGPEPDRKPGQYSGSDYDEAIQETGRFNRKSRRDEYM
jgi:hypothetical protein